MCGAFVRGDWRLAFRSAAFSMNPIQSFHCKLRGLATMLDGETARLLRALDGEDSGEWARASSLLSGRSRSVMKALTVLQRGSWWNGGELFVGRL